MKLYGRDAIQTLGFLTSKPELDSWVRKIPWRRDWQPTPFILAWKIPWTEEPGGLQSMGSHRVGYNWSNLAFKRLFSSSSLSAIRVVSSAYLRLLIFLPVILMSVHDSPSMACTPMFTAALFATAKTWKQPKCPSTEEWIKKMWHTYTMEYYSSI